ncbi:baseplate wedge subunit [uncultured Caudovirales phage]|uniref:Baseplate wedge subunit n=1 Tax=uncultured Caudovirales phage TaxID=2100421 RepID=A0A6J5LBA5_9CAUD|nr:baseplate wedge subunit [uncultured Caudovirales phage]
MSRYRGFSTVGRQFKFRLTDFDLAKQGLINHLQISKGEKLMNPEFGSSIWSMIFENMTSDLTSEIVAEVSRIVKLDPRLTLNDISIVEYEHGLQVNLALTYVGEIQPSLLKLSFERESGMVKEL